MVTASISRCSTSARPGSSSAATPVTSASASSANSRRARRTCRDRDGWRTAPVAASGRGRAFIRPLTARRTAPAGLRIAEAVGVVGAVAADAADSGHPGDEAAADTPAADPAACERRGTRARARAPAAALVSGRCQWWSPRRTHVGMRKNAHTATIPHQMTALINPPPPRGDITLERGCAPQPYLRCVSLRQLPTYRRQVRANEDAAAVASIKDGPSAAFGRLARLPGLARLPRLARLRLVPVTQHPGRHFLGGDRVPEVVAPAAVDR